MQKLKDKIVFISGASSGIGKACAEAFAKAGAHLILCARSTDKVKAVAEELQNKYKIEILSFGLDVQDKKLVNAAIDDLPEKWREIDILVNNAGILSKASIEELDEAEWDKVMNINVKSTMFASQQVLKHMISQGWGRIINISSLAGRMGGFSTGCAYSTSKAAILGMTMCIARKVAKNNITVNAIAPGTTESELLKGFTPEELKKLEEAIPVGRLGKPENIAETVVFLASDAASFITGAVIDVNGGMFMG